MRGSNCGERPVRVDSAPIAPALELATEHSLSACGAADVAAARDEGRTLVSVDPGGPVPGR